MTDIILEAIRAAVTGFVVLSLLSIPEKHSVIRRTSGWKFIVSGFVIVFFGTLIDITDNFDSLNRFVVIGDTEYQAFLEKIAGYLFGFVLIAVGFWKWLPQIVENERRSAEEIKQLKGILPICSHCKKIRDDEGYWSKVESYFREHSEVKFSHSICPECREKYYSHLKRRGNGNSPRQACGVSDGRSK